MRIIARVHGGLIGRRKLLRAGVASGVAALLGAVDADPGRAALGSPATLSFTPGRVLRPAARSATYARRVGDVLAEGLHGPRYAGAVALTAVDGEITTHTTVGYAMRYGAGGATLSPSLRVAMRPDSIFDLASLTKVFTALVALRLAEVGGLDLSAPVRHYLPAFRGGAKPRVTLRMLLAHTSGAPSGIGVTGRPDIAARRAAIVAEPLSRGAVPGRRLVYSDINLMLLGLIAERVTGDPLDELVRTHITAPLGLRDTGFRPRTWLSNGEWKARLVATQVARGAVHDGNARSLGGVSGHAGLFSTAADVAVVCQMLINGGEYAGRRLLRERTVRAMLTNLNRGLPAVDTAHVGRTSAHGLGVDLNQPWYMGGLASPVTFGHTGFTGTSFVVDPVRRVALVLLTNRVHVVGGRATVNPTRAGLGDVVAAAVGRPR